MNNNILELNDSIMGRCRIKVVLHEIYPTRNQWNENGITYLEQYTRDNADSVRGMPLCVEFLDDDKSIPYGHGLTGFIGNMPVFEDSIQVGTFEDWSIEDVEIDGEIHRCLCATGYINQNRYPNLVDWLVKSVNKGNRIYGSVEFSGKSENRGEVIYEDGYKDKGRVPIDYNYIGFVLLGGLRPADSSSIMLDISNYTVDSDYNEFDDIFGDNPKSTSKPANKTTTKSEFDDLMCWVLEHESAAQTNDLYDNFDDIFM